MKKMKKRFLAMGLCIAVLLCSLAPVQVADAASKKINLTVRYKGKTVTLETWKNGSVTDAVKTYAALKKKWGKANKVEKLNDAGGKLYTWKSGDTEIVFATDKNGKHTNNAVYVRINIRNKKASLCGIKVGMSKKQAMQKMIKLFGKKNVKFKKDGMSGYIYNDNTGPYLTIYVESGKVTGIFTQHS